MVIELELWLMMRLLYQNLTLDSSFRGINLKLGEGFNKIDFIALNQGDSGPNTD